MNSLGPTFVMDVGANTIKAGFATEEQPYIIPNCKMKVKSEKQRQYIGDQIEECKDCSGLYYMMTHHRGFILNWETQREIWEYIFLRKFKSLKTKETNIIITEPHFNFRPIQNNIDEVLFEEYAFNSVLRTDASFLAGIHYKDNKRNSDSNSSVTSDVISNLLACLVVDSGHSFTHVVPYILNERNGFKKFKPGIRRIDLGGKALTNHLKEVISYRQLNVMEETYVIGQCKEDICFVSSNFEEDLEVCKSIKKNNIVRDYILPDFTNVKRGYVRKPDWKDPLKTLNSNEPQFVRLSNERFQIPELLFRPSDVGINQVGVVEAIVDSISSAPKKVRPFLYSNIVLIGGNAKIPGFKERVLKGVRSYCPQEYTASVFCPDNPITYPWFGGKTLANEFPEILKEKVITKKEYDEFGDNKRKICIEKFDT